MKWYAYVALVAVSFALFVASAYLPVSETAEVVIAAPGAVGLISVLFLMARDQWQREHERLLKAEEQAHALAATSHMASVAFDKYADFCEKYVAKFLEILPTMTATGVTGDWAGYAQELCTIRQQFTVWVPREVASQLKEWEWLMGTAGMNKDSLKDVEVGKMRSKIVRETHDTFDRFMKAASEDQPPIREELLNTLADALCIDELTAMRKAVFERAVKTLDL